MNDLIDEVRKLYKGIYLKAFQRGYDYANGTEDYGFGEGTQEEEYKHIPRCNKEKYLKAWHHGCATGA